MKDLEVYKDGVLLGRLRVDSITDNDEGNITVMETYGLDDRQAAALNTVEKVELAKDFNKLPTDFQAIKAFAVDNSCELRVVGSNSGQAKFIVGGIVITPATLPAGTSGTAYSQDIDAVGMGQNFGFFVVGGALPTGLSLNNGTGAITGTPTVEGTSSFVIKAIDEVSGVGVTKEYSIVIA